MVTVHVLALTVELHLPQARSLKDKRATVRSVVDGARRRYQVAAAETGHQDRHQRAELGFAAVGHAPGHVSDVLDEVERFVWSFPELEVLTVERTWLEAA